jgi:hypothetical protein
MLKSAVYAGQLSLESVYRRDMTNMKLPVLHEMKKLISPSLLVNNNPIKHVIPNFGNLLTEIKEKEPPKEPPKIPLKRELNPSQSFNIEGYTPKHEVIPKKYKITGTKFLFENNNSPTQKKVIITPKLQPNSNLENSVQNSSQEVSQNLKSPQTSTQPELEPIPPKEVMHESHSDELYSSDEDLDDLQPQTVPTLADLEVSNFGFVWNALMEMVTQETILYCNGLPIPKQKPMATTDMMKSENTQLTELVLPPVDSISLEAARRMSFNQLIQNHIHEINSSLKLSVPIFGEFQGCVNTFQFRSTISVYTQAHWGAMALAIVLSLKKRRHCEDFVIKLESNIDKLSNQYGMSNQEIQIISALLTGD